MMIARLLMTAFAIFFAASGSASAERADLTQFWEFSSGNWTGGAYKNADGSFSHCYITAAYASKINLAIGITADYDLQMVLAHPEWNLPSDATYQVGLSVDNRFLGQFAATAVDTYTLNISMGDRGDILDRLRFGNVLEVAAAQETFRFDLAGTNRALGKVLECVNLAVALSPSKRNPFASNGSKANPFAYGSEKTSEEDRELVEALLTASGLSEPQFFDPALVDLEGAAYAWVSEAQSIAGLMFVVDASETDIDSFAQQILGSFATDCPGDFGSRSGDSIAVGASRLKKFSAACRSQTEGSSLFTAIAVKSDTDLMFILNWTDSESSNITTVNESLVEILTVLIAE